MRLTYEEINTRANQLAHELIARGVRPGDHVGILAGNTVPHVIALYAVAKAGAISAVFDVKWVARETAHFHRPVRLPPADHGPRACGAGLARSEGVAAGTA